MPFRRWDEAEARLRAPERLTQGDVRDLFVYLPQLSIAGERRLNAELALQTIEAVQQFENSSGKLAARLVALTAVLTVLTVVIAVFTILIAFGKK
jgi:hypothetical protein